MFYVCLNGKGTECEYLNSGFNYQSAFPPRRRGGLGAGAEEPGSLAAVGGEGRAGWRAGPELEGAGEPLSMAGVARAENQPGWGAGVEL